MDEYILRGIIRTLWIVLIFSWGVVIKVIALKIKNQRLTRLLTRIFISLALFVLMLIIGAVVDSYMQFQVSFIASTINLAFIGYILFLLIRFAWRLYHEDEEVHNTAGLAEPNEKFIDAPKVSTILDELFEAVSLNKRRGVRLEKMTSKYIQ